MKAKSIPAALLVVLALCGCATHGGFPRIPERYTALPPSPNSESYLVEITPQNSAAKAKRYDFEPEGDLMTARISTISASGARSEVRRTGEAATQLLRLLRGFDWASIEGPAPDESPTTEIPDNTEVVFKARTTKSYREVRIGLAACPAL